MKEALRQFQMLCDNADSFAITAGVVLTNLSIENGVDEVIAKNRWYAQISDCIIKGETSNVTDIEKEQFINMHLKLMGW